MKNRIQWIDIAKGIAMIFVMLGHSSFGKFSFLFTNFYMPFFFLLAGYTFKIKQDESFLDFIKVKFKRLIKPYLIFSILLYLIFCLTQISKSNFNLTNLTIPMMGIFYSRYYLFTRAYNPTQVVLLPINNSPLWFLTCLFIVYILFFIILKISKSNVQVLMYSLVSVLIGMIYNKVSVILLPWSLDIALICVFFMYIGYSLKTFKIDEKLYNFKIFIPSALAYLIISYINNGVNVSIGIYNNYILFLFASILGSVTWINISKIIEKYLYIFTKILSYIGKNTIIILALHLTIFSKITEILAFINKQTIESILVTIITLILMIPIIHVINSKMKWVVGN